MTSPATLRRRVAATIRRRATRAAIALWNRTVSRPVARLFHYDLIVKTSNFGSTSWLGIPIWQNVLDLWTIQETISEIRPALLIETGTHRGGSALFYAHIMALNGGGLVMTIDIARRHALSHPQIRFVHGSSTNPDVVKQAREAAEAADGPVMVVLDGNHDRDHVAAELELYAPLVTPGSLLLSQDGVIDVLRLFRSSRPGPLEANRAFLANHSEFELDRERSERFPLTHHPMGWMRRRAA